MGFATEQLQPLFSLGAYISFIISFLLPFGIVFELPLFLIVLAKLGIISSSFLASKRKIFLVLAFVIGAVAAPTPDVFSQVMVAIPLLLLYEISIITIKYVLKR
jgi:sec-independent protein translocase protein TatC